MKENSTEQPCYLVVNLTILLNVYCPDQISTADQITLNPGGQRANIMEMAMEFVDHFGLYSKVLTTSKKLYN